MPPPAAPVVNAVPTTVYRGNTIVFQLANFPPNTDFTLSIIDAAGKTRSAGIWTISSSGTSLATFATKASDPVGTYVATFQNGGVIGRASFLVQ